MQLPESARLPVNLLAACFNSTSATYKYYWLISILQEIEDGKQKIDKRDLFARMISNAWYTVNYFHVSFGKQDLIQNTIEIVKRIEYIPIDEKQQSVFRQLLSTRNADTLKQLWHFDKNVPHWFLSPWFPGKDKAIIYQASRTFSNDCIYALSTTDIMINPQWKQYLTSNSKILKDFCLWNLSLFLQAKNPNVPDIANKLIRPAVRNNLTKQRIHFWDPVISELGSVKCIYTDKTLVVGNYALEHFVPYNFVSHDLIWNLIPADKSFNSRKSDKLPPLEKYFSSFFKLQNTAVNIINKKLPSNKLLEEYFTIFPDLYLNFTEQKFRETIQPLITIASNNGFQFLSE